MRITFSDPVLGDTSTKSNIRLASAGIFCFHMDSGKVEDYFMIRFWVTLQQNPSSASRLPGFFVLSFTPASWVRIKQKSRALRAAGFC